MVMHTLQLEDRERRISVSLTPACSRVSSRIANATQRNPVLGKKIKQVNIHKAFFESIWINGHWPTTQKLNRWLAGQKIYYLSNISSKGNNKVSKFGPSQSHYQSPPISHTSKQPN